MDVRSEARAGCGMLAGNRLEQADPRDSHSPSRRRRGRQILENDRGPGAGPGDCISEVRIQWKRYARFGVVCDALPYTVQELLPGSNDYMLHEE